jgi:chromosome segregation ATPase
VRAGREVEMYRHADDAAAVKDARLRYLRQHLDAAAALLDAADAEAAAVSRAVEDEQEDRAHVAAARDARVAAADNVAAARAAEVALLDGEADAIQAQLREEDTRLETAQGELAGLAAEMEAAVARGDRLTRDVIGAEVDAEELLEMDDAQRGVAAAVDGQLRDVSPMLRAADADRRAVLKAQDSTLRFVESSSR